MSKKTLAIATIIIAILLDQIIKIYVKTHFVLGEEVVVFDWFRIHFTENNGMAMGFEFGGKAGKLVNINSAGANYIQPTYAEIHGGPLSGGGAQKNRSSNTYTYVHGGDGGIGGGGGGCRNASSASYAVGGDGGSGVVIIQYLPA